MIKTSTQHWWNDYDRKKTEMLDENPVKILYTAHKQFGYL
jgi:hypothetical protein